MGEHRVPEINLCLAWEKAYCGTHLYISGRSFGIYMVQVLRQHFAL